MYTYLHFVGEESEAPGKAACLRSHPYTKKPQSQSHTQVQVQALSSYPVYFIFSEDVSGRRAHLEGSVRLSGHLLPLVMTTMCQSSDRLHLTA